MGDKRKVLNNDDFELLERLVAGLSVGIFSILPAWYYLNNGIRELWNQGAIKALGGYCILISSVLILTMIILLIDRIIIDKFFRQKDSGKSERFLSLHLYHIIIMACIIIAETLWLYANLRISVYLINIGNNKFMFAPIVPWVILTPIVFYISRFIGNGICHVGHKLYLIVVKKKCEKL
ncbi:hypothetical protein UT300012_22200 [Paraclostridium bifermentans]